MKGTIQTYKLNIGTVWVASTAKGICNIDMTGNKRRFLRNLPKHIEWTENKINTSGKLPNSKLDLSTR